MKKHKIENEYIKLTYIKEIDNIKYFYFSYNKNYENFLKEDFNFLKDLNSKLIFFIFNTKRNLKGLIC